MGTLYKKCLQHIVQEICPENVANTVSLSYVTMTIGDINTDFTDKAK
jgi:hypothetical protein